MPIDQVLIVSIFATSMLEHCPELFISGNVNQMLDRMVPICEEAQRFNVTADYDISV